MAIDATRVWLGDGLQLNVLGISTPVPERLPPLLLASALAPGAQPAASNSLGRSTVRVSTLLPTSDLPSMRQISCNSKVCLGAATDGSLLTWPSMAQSRADFKSEASIVTFDSFRVEAVSAFQPPDCCSEDGPALVPDLAALTTEGQVLVWASGSDADGPDALLLKAPFLDRFVAISSGGGFLAAASDTGQVFVFLAGQLTCDFGTCAENIPIDRLSFVHVMSLPLATTNITGVSAGIQTLIVSGVKLDSSAEGGRVSVLYTVSFSTVRKVKMDTEDGQGETFCKQSSLKGSNVSPGNENNFYYQTYERSPLSASRLRIPRINEQHNTDMLYRCALASLPMSQGEVDMVETADLASLGLPAASTPLEVAQNSESPSALASPDDISFFQWNQGVFALVPSSGILYHACLQCRIGQVEKQMDDLGSVEMVDAFAGSEFLPISAIMRFKAISLSFTYGSQLTHECAFATFSSQAGSEKFCVTHPQMADYGLANETYLIGVATTVDGSLFSLRWKRPTRWTAPVFELLPLSSERDVTPSA